jgi:hypothetical protein
VFESFDHEPHMIQFALRFFDVAVVTLIFTALVGG